MKKFVWISLVVAATLLAALSGYFAGSRDADKGHTQAAGSTSQKRKVLYWKAPMDPNFRSDKPGKSPMGMPLVPVYADSGGGEPSDVKIDPAVVNNLGVRTAAVRRGSLSHRIEAVGYVGYDQDTETSINTRADGWVEKLAVKSVGDSVRRGQLLYQLFSPKLATAEREYLTALASGSASLVKASRQRMRALGFSTEQVNRLKRTGKVQERVARRAQSNGVVVKLGVREGAYVMPMTQVMQLADLRTIWVLVEVDESDAALVQVGQQAEAAFDAFPGRQWVGRVDHIYPDVSARTRTVKLRLRFANPDLRLQPNMYAHITLDAAPQSDVLHIPEQALIRTGQSQRVIVALGDGRFDVCPVEAGFSSGGQVEILRGLVAGQRVVTSAQFMIDSEANVTAASLRLGAGRPECTDAASHDEPAPGKTSGRDRKPEATLRKDGDSARAGSNGARQGHMEKPA